jgi:hypothetical protein
MGARTGSCAAQALILCQIAKVSWNVCLWRNSRYYKNGIKGYPLKDFSSPFGVIGMLQNFASLMKSSLSILDDDSWYGLLKILVFLTQACWPSFKTLFVG